MLLIELLTIQHGDEKDKFSFSNQFKNRGCHFLYTACNLEVLKKTYDISQETDFGEALGEGSGTCRWKTLSSFNLMQFPRNILNISSWGIVRNYARPIITQIRGLLTGHQLNKQKNNWWKLFKTFILVGYRLCFIVSLKTFAH